MSSGTMMVLTRDDVTRVHSVLVFNEAETVHELDLGDFAGSVSLKMGLDFGFGGIAGEVAQVEARGGDFGHGGLVDAGRPTGNLAW